MHGADRATAPSDEPSPEDVLGYVETLSNWGRWGPDDELGTLNLITPDARAAAGRLVQHGVTVSCGWDIETSTQPDQLYGAPVRHMLMTGQGHHDPDASETAEVLGRGSAEWFGLAFHGLTETHLDAPSHKFWQKQMYNGVPAEMVTSWSGARRNAVTAAADGIVGRGVLLDVAAVRGVDWLEAPDGAGVADLEAAEGRQDVRVGAGDIVLLRTGGARKRHQLGRPDVRQEGIRQSGWRAECLPWLHERGAALIGADTANDIFPNPYDDMKAPIHIVGLVAMGLWLLDNCDLEDLAGTSERLQRWEFLFSLGPLRIQGGTGSPVNPLATF